MDFNKELSYKMNLIEESLKKYTEKKYPNIIYDAMNYSLFAGGKRIRPILMLSACEAVGGDIKDAIPFACALEMIHTYSLIHDDLPAIDDDDYRRGKPTCHKVFDESMAILAGDGLLNTAFELMTKAVEEKFEMRFAKASRIIASASGTSGMIGGQVVDIISENKPIDSATLIYIHSNKTAALIKAALQAGAIIGRGNVEQIDTFDKIGYTIGLAFQIKDDILDITGTLEVLGKPVFSDVRNKKTTYVSLHGMKKSEEDYKKLSLDAVELTERFGEKGKFLTEYSKMLIDRIK